MGNLDDVVMYTDGACSGNPGPGGWGVLMSCRGNTKEIWGGECATTNNRMELTAVVEGLRSLRRCCAVEVRSDSTYVVDGVNRGWVYGWRGACWKKSGGRHVPNRELWEMLLELLERHEVRMVWVKGHAGERGNERADELARCGVAEAREALALMPEAGGRSGKGAEVFGGVEVLFICSRNGMDDWG